MSSHSANARGKQGQANASWSDHRRSGELLDAYIGAPLRLSQDPSIQPGWNTNITCLSKLEWGQLITIERETARWLNQSSNYLVIVFCFCACICNLTCCFSGTIRKQADLATGCKAKNRRLVQSSCWSSRFRPGQHPCKSAVHLQS